MTPSPAGPRPLTDAERHAAARESLNRLRLTPGALDIDYCTVADALDDLAALRAEVARLRLENARLHAIRAPEEIAALRDQIAVQKAEIARLTAELAARNDEVRKSEDQELLGMDDIASLLRQREEARAEVARLEAENGRLRGELREGHVGQLHAELARAVEANEGLSAALVEETARRLWAEAYLDALAAYGNVGADDRWEDMAREHDLWRDRARAALARAPQEPSVAAPDAPHAEGGP